MTLTLLQNKMFNVGDLPVLTFGNCVLKIKHPLKLYVCFLRFFVKIQKNDFLRFVELLHTFSRTLKTSPVIVLFKNKQY